MQQHAFLGAQDVAEDGLRQVGCGDARLSQMNLHPHLHIAAARRGFRFDSIVIPVRKNQHASFSAGMLDGRAHQRVDQLLQHDLARHRFGDLHHGRQVEAFDGRLDRGALLRGRLVGPELRMELIELSNLAFGAPAQVTIPRIPKVGRRNLLEASRRVKASGPLVGDRLVVDEAVRVRRTRGLFIKVLRVEHASFDPGDFSADDRRAVFKGDGVVLGPHANLLVVANQGVEVQRLLIGRCRIASCSAPQARRRSDSRRPRSLPLRAR